jgi:segregation and condensation protein A
MSDILANLEKSSFVEFVNLFRPEEGRMGVTVTFVAILELVREGLIDIVQTEAYAPLHVRSAQGARGLRLAVDNDAAEDEAISEIVEEADATDVAANDEQVDDLDEGFDEPGDVPQTDGETHE